MKTTRKLFLKSSIAVPIIFPSAVRAAETAANNRITVGFIDGTGDVKWLAGSWRDYRKAMA